MEIKSQIRNTNKKCRINMPSSEVDKLSCTITNKIQKLKFYQDAEFLLAYSSIQNEVNLSTLIVDSIKNGKKVFLPRVNGEDINFFRINSIDEFNSLRIGSFKIMEPNVLDANEFQKQYNSSSTCTILVPGIGFSIKGQRIGFGKGYYDRFLSEHKNINKVGVCYDWQITDAFESNDFDIDMDLIITDKREVYRDDKLREYM